MGMDSQNDPTVPGTTVPSDGATSDSAAAAPVEFYRAQDYRPGQSVGYMMKRLVTSLSQQVDRRLEAHGVTDAQWIPLLRIWRGEGSTVAELARQCQADGGAMTRMLDRLEAKGLLRRVRSTTDRRVVQLELTAEGEAAAAQIPVVLAAAQNALLAGFTDTEWKTLCALLERMQHNAEALKHGPLPE